MSEISQMPNHRKFRRKGEYIARVVAGETIVVPICGNVGDLESIYNLNQVASLIWEMTDGRTSVGQTVEAVCREFDVPPDTAARDTLEFLHGLELSGLVEAA